MNKNYSLSELNTIAKEVVENSKHKTLLFYGKMGVGKTTLIKELCKVLGIDDVTSSPTFSIVNEYVTNSNEKVYHFDFYRIEDEEEAYDIGFEDYFYDEAWCLIEWPENVQNLLPLNAVEIHLTQLDDGQRNIQLKQPI
ncbi:MAG: tRNA (adenosine(37)-N6)-threonylcarbamoyltransferase complex ATPase subunit type 1 TsaE [Flavobacteriaceae bacterium]